MIIKEMEKNFTYVVFLQSDLKKNAYPLSFDRRLGQCPILLPKLQNQKIFLSLDLEAMAMQSKRSCNIVIKKPFVECFFSDLTLFFVSSLLSTVHMALTRHLVFLLFKKLNRKKRPNTFSFQYSTKKQIFCGYNDSEATQWSKFLLKCAKVSTYYLKCKLRFLMGFKSYVFSANKLVFDKLGF